MLNYINYINPSATTTKHAEEVEMLIGIIAQKYETINKTIYRSIDFF